MKSFRNKYINFLFDDKDFYKKLVTLAIPVTVQNLIASSLGMVDTVMVGALGNEPMAGVGAANQFGLIVFFMYAAIHGGASIYVAQFWGKKDYKNIGKVVNIGIALGIGVSLLFSIVGIFFPSRIISIFTTNPVVIEQGAAFLRLLSMSFVFGSVSLGLSVALRSIGKSIMPMVISGIALGINTLLNYLLIFGAFGFPALGVRGSAIATLTSRIVEMIIFLVVISRSYEMLSIRISVLRQVTSDLFKRVIKTMVPVILNELCWSVGFAVYSVAYGRISTEAFDAVQINNTVCNLFLVVGFGMASASAVMTGHMVGAGDEKKGREYAWRFVILCIMGGVVIGAFMYITAPLVVGLFKVTEDVLQTAIVILTINAIIIPIRFTNIVAIVGILRGGGDAKYAFIVESLTMWLVGVPMAFIGAFVLRLEVQWVILMVMAEEIIKMACVVVRLKSSIWIKNVVKEV
ncbi:MAG: MATE family efflux transporter [Ruminiclostridium sp.]